MGLATITLLFEDDGRNRELSEILLKCDRDVFRNLLEHTVEQVAREHDGI